MKDNTRRIGVALVVLQKLREAIEANGNVYHVALVPNLTSVSDVLTLPEGILQQQLATPDMAKLIPTEEQLQELEAMWQGRVHWGAS